MVPIIGLIVRIYAVFRMFQFTQRQNEPARVRITATGCGAIVTILIVVLLMPSSPTPHY